MDHSYNESEIIMPSLASLVNSDGSPQTVIDKGEKSTLESCYKLLIHFEDAVAWIDFVSDNEILRVRNVIEKLRETFNRIVIFLDVLEEVKADHEENEGHNTYMISDYFIRSLHRPN